MAMVINHNISAMNAQRSLGINNMNLGKSLEKLSSGYRINVGADGPADLIISEQLRAQNMGLTRAVRNTSEAMNVLGIAEGALNEMNEILKKMRSLALHAANSGITSPVQVQADQQELDSGIQTIDRIANTTKYSDQLLLNGSKEIVFGRTTSIRSTQNNALVDVALSSLDQVFKRDGFSVSIAFNGAENPDATTGLGDALVEKEARKAYFELDSANNKADVDSTTRALNKAQSFILTGDKGSRLFNFDEGATMGQIARTIDNVSDSTGVEATLTFASDQTFTNSTTVSANNAVLGGASVRTADDFVVGNNRDSNDALVITDMDAGVLANAVVGKNTDGLGRIFIKVTGDTSYELYKDESLSAESLVGHGEVGSAMLADNSSGLSGFQIDAIAAGNAGHTAVLYTAGLTDTDVAGIRYSGSFDTAGSANSFDTNTAFFGGVKLGQNTDAEGKIYFKTVMDGAAAGTVYAYNNARMADEDLVAKSQDGTSLGATTTIILDEVRNNEDTTGTGLTIAISTNTVWASSAGSELTGSVQFTNLGVRLSSEDYGSDASIRIQQNSGTMWQYYEQADNSGETMVDASGGSVTVQQNGSDAELTINGQQVNTNGLTLDLSTQDVTASLVFNEGKAGSTTIAQVGYTEGTIFTKAEALTDVDSSADSDADGIFGGFLTNAGHSTLETLEHYQGGMQFQLGEGSGDQERTVYGIDSMGVANLGLTRFTGVFDQTKSVVEDKMLSLQDVLGGGIASLGNDPIKALSIIDQAIEDVSSLRARLGATQSNLLQTNINSLNVAIENIAKTESAIRDADMAYETTEFTKNQVLQSAATSMLAQANAQSQQVLQLLG